MEITLTETTAKCAPTVATGPESVRFTCKAKLDFPAESDPKY
jgi:hypothetical protein